MTIMTICVQFYSTLIIMIFMIGTDEIITDHDHHDNLRSNFKHADYYDLHDLR
jgi:hypothetical protein